MDLRVEIVRNPAIRGYDVWITNKSQDGSFQVCEPFELKFHTEEQGVMPLPTLRLGGGALADEFLQSFAEALERSGYKTPELAKKDAEINAIKYHLEDMRLLAFKANIPVILKK